MATIYLCGIGQMKGRLVAVLKPDSITAHAAYPIVRLSLKAVRRHAPTLRKTAAALSGLMA